MNEMQAPPTDRERECRDTLWVKQAQQDTADGYKARLDTMHPCKRTRDGKEIPSQREPKWQLCEIGPDGKSEYAEQQCPLKEAHRRERWISGFIMADGICAEKGLHAATAAHPLRVRRKKPVTLAEPVEMFPDAILSRDAAREHSARLERVRHGQNAVRFTLADTEDA